MKLLSTDKLQIVLDSAVATNQLQMDASYYDIETTNFGISGFGNNPVDTNNTTIVTLVDSPASGNVRTIDSFSIYGADTDIAAVNIISNRNGTTKTIKKVYLSLGDSLIYSKDSGFELERVFQSVKSFTVHGDAGVNFAMTNATLLERFAGNTTRHLFMVDLLGYTQVRLRANKQVASASAGTPQFRAKYYTSYNTTVGNFLPLTAGTELYVSMAAVGYFDSGWVDLVAGAKVNGICIGFTEIGGDGAIDPALGATDILFR